ncbi:hypothetical protein [Ferrovibrio terrae]
MTKQTDKKADDDAALKAAAEKAEADAQPGQRFKTRTVSWISGHPKKAG